MYPSVRDDILKSAGYPTIKEGLDSLGFDAVELAVMRDYTTASIMEAGAKIDISTKAGLDALRNQLGNAKVRASALLLENNFGRDDLDDEIKWVIAAVRAAGELGIPAVRIDAIMRGERDLPLETRVSAFAGAMGRILDATSGLSVEMGIENHGYQGNQPEFLDMVLDRVNSSRVGLTMDTGNFYWAGHPLDRVYEILERFAPRTKHTHAKNIKYPPETRNTQRELGWEYGKYVSSMREGDIDHARVVSILKKAGYDRDLCLEDESLGKWPVEERQAILRQDADFFREILEVKRDYAI